LFSLISKKITNAIIGIVKVMVSQVGMGMPKAIPLFRNGCHPKYLQTSFVSVQWYKDCHFKN